MFENSFEFAFLIIGMSILTSLLVYFISIISIKEKTFEEAIKEQKQRSEELLGKPIRKTKKVVEGKKNKTKKLEVPERHVVIKEDIVEVNTEEEPVIIRRPSISEPTKSILINKQEHSPIVLENKTENHFEQTLPKDDVVLKKKPEKVEKVEKEKKEKNPLQLINNLDLSPTETQILIDSLLSKQPIDWTSKNSENLKKQIELKEMKINELESNLNLVQIKLKEVRNEVNIEKSKSAQAKKTYEDLLNNKQTELNQLQIRLRLAEHSVLKNEELGKTCGILGEELERVKGECGRREGEWRAKVDSLERDLGDAYLKCQNLERELGAKGESFKRQASQLTHAFTSNEELTKQIEHLKLAFGQTEQKLHHSNSLLQEKESTYFKELTKFKEQEKFSQMKFEKLEREGEESRNKIEELLKNELNYKKILHDLQNDKLESQRWSEECGGLREKNDELRMKNGKMLESLKATEKALEEKTRNESERENALKRFLVEDIGMQYESNWMHNLREKIDSMNQTILSKEELIKELQSKGTEFEKDCEKLKEEVLHYQSVLGSTEILLANLQKSLETEESKWAAKLAEKDAQIEAILQHSPTNGNMEQGDSSTPSTPTSEKKKKKKVLGFFSK